MLQIVSEEYLKTVTPMAGNIDPADLQPHIMETQNNRLRVLLGKKFYDYLMTKTASTLSTNELTLMGYIKPYLAWYIIYDAIPSIHYKVKPKGVVGGIGDTVERSSHSEIKWLMGIYENKAESYGDQLQQFLWNNKEDYEFYNHPDNDYTNPYRGTTFQTDIVFDSPGGCGGPFPYPFN